jgi:hypothetical protein
MILDKDNQLFQRGFREAMYEPTGVITIADLHAHPSISIESNCEGSYLFYSNEANKCAFSCISSSPFDLFMPLRTCLLVC